MEKRTEKVLFGGHYGGKEITFIFVPTVSLPADAPKKNF